MKRVFIFLLVGMLLVFQPMQAYADAGSIAVAGGSIATGGLSAAALAGLSGPAVVIVFTALIAVGMNVRLTQASQQAGMTKTEYVKSKIEQYCNEAGKTAGVFYNGILSGASVLQNGSIALSDQASLQIKQFINWLFESGAVSDGTTTGNDMATMDGYDFKYVSTGVYNNEFTYNGRAAKLIVENSNNGGTTYEAPFYLCYVKLASGSISVLALSNTRDYCYIYSENTGSGGSRSTMGLENNLNYKDWGIPTNWINAGMQTVPLIETTFTSISAFVRSLSGDFEMTSNPTADGFTGSRDDWNDRSSVFDPANSLPTILNPGLIGQIPIPADTDITVNVSDYLDALQRVLDKLQDIAIKGTDRADGIPRDYDIPDIVDADPTIDKPDPAPADPRTPVLDPDVPADPDIAVQPLTIQLKGVFPFCIPFDVVDMLKMLKADPVAPTYTVNWNIPIINQALHFTIDLSPFNGVASILRTMEIIAFCIGLAFVTRSMFIRG